MYLTQIQTNYMNSALLYSLICIMFQVRRHFIYVLLFTEPGSLSVMSISVGHQTGGQF